MLGPATPHPRPPAGNSWPLPIIKTPAGLHLFRLSNKCYPDPIYFGRQARWRFDAPDRSYGVCYWGTTLDCCFVEVFAVARASDETGGFVTLADMRQYTAVEAVFQRELRLAYFADDGLPMLGIDTRLTGGDDYRLAQDWSRSVLHHLSGVDGIFYPARRHNALYSVALFERAHDAFAHSRLGTLGYRRWPALWVETARILDRFQLAVYDETGSLVPGLGVKEGTKLPISQHILES